MILPIVAYGDPILKKECEEIDENYPNLKQLISDMFETMYKAKGVGLAAPQIGKNIRLFIVDGSPFAEDEEEEDQIRWQNVATSSDAAGRPNPCEAARLPIIRLETP